MEWQPIETAPKDGTRVLVVSEMRGTTYAGPMPRRLMIAAWIQTHAWKPHGWWSDGGNVYPTHWMPLPELPEAPR